MSVRIRVKVSCFVPEFIMEIKVPDNADTEEYIDELIESVFDDEFKYNAEWEFC